jgi:glycosyltransferase involved in cell wall biosynthesis
MTWIVCEATADWDDPLWTNKQHLMSRLGDNGHRVLYLDSLGLRRPSASSRDIRRIGRRLRRWRPTACEVSPGVWRDSPLVLPLQSSRLARRLNAALLSWRLRRNRRRLGIGKAVLWTYSPMGYRLYDPCWQMALVYHCVDNIANDPSMDSTFLTDEERRTVSAATVCIGSSRALVQKLRDLGAADPLYWPNPADTAAFSSTMRRPPATPAVIGFVGAVQGNKVDFPLLVAVVRALPDVTVCLAGPTATGGGAPVPSELSSMPNVALPGVVARESLAALLATFEVGIIPYRINSYTDFIYPMKVFEYLAAGLPVVSTPLPSLVGEVEHVTFAADPTSFVCAIRDAIHASRAEGGDALRRSYAARHSWDERLTEAGALLRRLAGEG